MSACPASSPSPAVMSRRVLAQVAVKSFNVLPNTADPERVFSELGRVITSFRAMLVDAQSKHMPFITADCRVETRRACEGVNGGGSMQKTSAKLSHRAAALLRLKSI
jgi:hypothetical protein